MKSIESLKQIIAAKDADILALKNRQAELEALLKFYEGQFRLSKHRQFGSSSEKHTIPEQFGLFDEAENIADPKLPEPELEQIIYTRRKKAGKREDDLSGLPVEVIEHKLPADDQVCPDCGGNLHEMGHDSRRELAIIPAQVKVVEHKRAVYSCRNCEKTGYRVPILKAPMPEPVIKGSLASPSAVAHIMTQKYVMYAPLYRQEQEFKRQDVYLSRQTMANWVIRCAEDWLNPVYERLKMKLLAGEVLHADETTLQVLKEPGKPAKSKSYMWLYRTSGDTNKHIVLFEYKPSRSSDHPKHFLSEFKGLLHADGYSGYHALPDRITVIGCWVHLRRKFTDALKTIPHAERSGSIADEAIRRIGYLFHLEDQWANRMPEERHRLRLEKSEPLATGFFNWLETQKVMPKIATGEAIKYALGQKKWLLNVYLDGRTEISNNRAENAVRPFTLGRKNWLFCNTVKGADASAAVYSIIETAKANGLKPFEYLEFLFETLPNAKAGDIDLMLPWGKAIPDRCRMPIKERESQNAEKKRV